METYSRENDEKTLNLITYVEVEQAHQSDAHALIPAIESTKERDIAPETLLADASYGSDNNVTEANKKDVEVISPASGNVDKSKLSLADFETTSEGEIISCPQGHEPINQEIKEDKHKVHFNPETCAGCPMASQCPVKRGKRTASITFYDKSLRLANRRAFEETKNFLDQYQFRSEVEATMSEYDTLTGVKQLRIRELNSVRYCVVMKAIALNIYRAARARKGANSAYFFLFLYFFTYFACQRAFSRY
ncbi:hypothetical protein GMMP15_610003 [Candidatus Magnetomoraceae bacterium gMMP-15]